MKQNWLLFLMLLSMLPAAAQVSFEAYANVREVSLNSYFEVVFTLKNADADAFSPPAFEHFNVIAGPSRSISTTMINGRVNKEMSYSYTLQPRRTGQITIGAATVRTEGKTLTTKPLTIEVVEGKSLPKGVSGKQIFLRAELSTDRAVVGQQVLLDYKLYTAADVDSYSILEETDYQGFFAQDLRRFNPPLAQEVVNGVRYITKILKRVALFPQQAGALQIAPLRMELSVVIEEGSNRRNNFFFSRPTQREIVQTEPITLRVQPLPPNAPPAFTGAVGDFTADFTLSSTEASTDDVLSLRLKLRGNGDIKRVQPPALLLSDSFEVYAPRVLDEATYENMSGELIADKEIEYLLLPKYPGNYQIQPAFSWFNPATNTFAAAEAPVFKVAIRPGSLRPSDANIADSTAEVPRDIRFIKTALQLQKTQAPFLGSVLFWILALTPLLLLIAALIFKQIQKRRNAVSATERRIRRARQEALRHLQLSEKHLQAGQSRAFFDEVSKALLGYVGDKLQIPRSMMSKENVREKLHTLRIEDALIDNFMQIIQTCEAALFAGQDNPAAMSDTYRQALDTIARIEALLGSR